MKFRSYAVGLAGLASYIGAVLPGAVTVAPHVLWRSVTFEGGSVRVPASWPVVDLRRHPSACPRLDVHAVYLGRPGPDPLCPAGLIGRTEAVMIGPVRPGSPDLREATRLTHARGRSVLTNPGWAESPTITAALPPARAREPRAP